MGPSGTGDDSSPCWKPFSGQTELVWPPLVTLGLLRVDPLSPFRLDVGMAHGAGEGLEDLNVPSHWNPGWVESSIAWHRSWGSRAPDLCTPARPAPWIRDRIQGKQRREAGAAGRASGPVWGTLGQGPLRKTVSVALFSSTSCFSRHKGMWPFSILPQAGGEEGGEAEGWRQPGLVTFPEKNCVAQKVKGVFPQVRGPPVLSLAFGRGTRRERQGCWAHLPASPRWAPSSLPILL